MGSCELQVTTEFVAHEIDPRTRPRRHSHSIRPDDHRVGTTREEVRDTDDTSGTVQGKTGTSRRPAELEAKIAGVQQRWTESVELVSARPVFELSGRPDLPPNERWWPRRLERRPPNPGGVEQHLESMRLQIQDGETVLDGATGTALDASEHGTKVSRRRQRHGIGIAVGRTPSNRPRVLGPSSRQRM